MADNDILLKVGLDPSGMTEGVRKGVRESLAELERLQRAAVDDNPNARVAQLPASARQTLSDSTVSKSDTSELNKQRQAQQKLIEQRAKLIALAQQEASVVARASGATASTKQLGGIRAGGEAALASSLGLDKLTPAIKGQITKIINEINREFASLDGLSGPQLQNKFRTLSNQILPTVGITDKATVRKASTIVSEDRTPAAARSQKAQQTEASASEKAAKTAQTDAADAERSSKAQQASRRRQEAAEKAIETSLEKKKAAVRKLAEEGGVLLFHGTNAEITDRVQPRSDGANRSGSYASSNPDTALEYARIKREEQKAGRERLYAVRSSVDDFNNLLREPGDRSISQFDQTSYQGKAFSPSGFDIIGEVTRDEALALELEYARIIQALKEQGSSVIRTVEWNRKIESVTAEQAVAQQQVTQALNKRAVNLTKAQARELAFFLDAEETPSGKIGGTASRPTFEYDPANTAAVRSFATNIEDIGQDKISSGVRGEAATGRVEVAAANKLLADITESEASVEAQKLALAKKDLITETETTTAKTETARAQKSVAQLMRSLESQVRRGIITAEEGNKQLVNRGVVAPGETTKLNTIENQRVVDNLPQREATFDTEEQSLIRALIRKREALDKQTLVLTSNYASFKSAEELLIDALKRKASALNSQTLVIPDAVPQAPAPTTSSTPRTKRTFAGDDTPDARSNAEKIAERDSQRIKDKAAADQIRYGNLDFTRQELRYLQSEQKKIDEAERAAALVAQEAAIQQQTLNENLKQLGIEEETTDLLGVLKARVSEGVLSAKAGNQILQQAGVIRSGETTVLDTTEERRRQRQAELARLRSATSINNLPLNEKFGVRPIKPDMSSGFMSDMFKLQDSLDAAVSSRQIPRSIGELGLNKLVPSEEHILDNAAQVLAGTMLDASTKMALAFEGFEDELIGAKATVEAMRRRFAGLTTQRIIDDPLLFKEATLGDARNMVGQRVLASGREAEIVGDKTLQAELIKAELELLGFTRERATQIARLIAADKTQIQSILENITATEAQTAVILRATTADSAAMSATVESLAARRGKNLAADLQFYQSDEGRRQLQEQNRLNEIKRAGRSGKPDNAFARFADTLGYRNQGSGSPLEFFGGGALASLRYGLPSMLLYGAGSGIMNTIKEAEQLQVQMAILETQFDAVFGQQDFGPVRQGILDIAKETGLAADELAGLQIQITGAFSGETISGLSGKDLVTQQTQSAGKLAQTVGLPLAEITDGLTAASLAFNRSFEEIGDVALSIEQESGVLAKETISFIGDIAPVAKEAGYSLEEFSAIAAVAQQRSGRSGAALAESFGRVIPSITEQKDKLLELAAIDPKLATDSFVDAIRQSDPKAILDEIGASYENLNKEAKQTVITLLGGRREAQALIPALANRELVEKYQKVGENSAGTLDERFQKIRGTITNTIQRIIQQFRELGVELLDSGLTDVFENALKLAGLFIKVLNPIVKIVGAINDAFGGLPIQIAAGVAALKVLQALLIQTKTDAAGAVTRTIAGTNIAAPGAGLSFGNGLGFRQNFARTFRQSVTPSSFFGKEMAAKATLPQLAASAPVGSSAFGAGKGLLAGIGGGSVALGATFVGIGALAAIYGKVNNERDKAEKELAELRDEIKKGNEDVDFFNPETSIEDRTKRIREIEAQFQAEAKRSDSWYESWNGLLSSMGVIQTKAERLGQSLAELKGFDADTQEFFDTADTTLNNMINEKFIPTLGRGTRKFRQSLELANKFEVDKQGNIYNPSNRISGQAGGISNPFQTTYRADEQAFLTESARLAGVDVTELDPQIALALSDPGGNAAELLNQIAAQTGDYADVGEKAVTQAQAIKRSLYKAGLTDDEISKYAANLTKASDLSDLEVNDLNIQELQAAFSVGRLSFDQYLERTKEKLAQRRAILKAGDTTEATELQLLQVAQQETEVNKQISDNILAGQERLNSIAQAYGINVELPQIVLNTNLANLNDPNFRDRDARLQAALNIVEAQKQIDLENAKATGDINQILQVIRDGSKIQSTALATIAVGSMDEQQWFITAKDNLSSVFSKLFDTGIQPEDIDRFYESVFADVLDDGALNPNNSQGLQSRISSILGSINAASFEGLSNEDQQALLSSFDSLIALLNFAGTSREELLALIRRQKGNSKKTDAELQAILDGILTNNPIQNPEQIAKFNRDQGLKEIENAYVPFQTNAENNTVALALYAKQEADQKLLYLQQNGGTKEEIDAALKEQMQAENALRDAFASAQSSKLNYYATIAAINGDLVGSIGLEIQALDEQINAAVASQDWIEVNNLEAQKAQKQDQQRKQIVADANAGTQLLAGLATINGDLVSAAEYAVQEANRNVGAARTPEEKANAILAQAQALDELRKTRLEEIFSTYELFAAYLDGEGDSLNAAITRQKEAQIKLDNARGTQEKNQALIAKIQADNAVRQEQAAIRDASYALFSSEIAGNDPLAQAKISEALAQEQLRDARGVVAKANAQIALTNAQKAVTDAMNDARYSVYSLRQAELQAMGNDVGAAQVAAELARQQLNDAIKAGSGVAAINNARAAFITADKAAKDAVFQDRMDEYKWLLDMGRISKGQYVNYLEGLKSTLIPGTKQFKDLELTIKQLKDDIGGDLQANLPTSLALPTLYEVRRFSPSNIAANGLSAGIGYQDNRQVSIAIAINNASEDTESIVMKTLENTLGVSRNGYGERRF